MPEYHFISRLPSSETSGKVYRMEFHAVVASGPEENPKQLTLSFDDFGSTLRDEILLEELPQLLFGKKLAQPFKAQENGNTTAYVLELDLRVAANKVIALDIVERLLSFKDLGYETKETLIISTLASNIKQKYATDLAGRMISSQTIYHDLFALYQELGGTKTLADFEAQEPVQPPAGFGMGGSSFFITSSTPREEHSSKGGCCLVM